MLTTPTTESTIALSRFCDINVTGPTPRLLTTERAAIEIHLATRLLTPSIVKKST